MADFWGMSFVPGLEDDDIFYPILWIMLIISLFVFIMAWWKWQYGTSTRLHSTRGCNMADFWGMSFVPGLEDDDIFYPILWIMLIISLFVFIMAWWKWQKERQRKGQHGGNQENSRGAPHPLTLSPLPTVWDFHTSSQHARMHSSAPRQTDDTSERLDQMNRKLQAMTGYLEMLVLDMPEGSDGYTTSVTESENLCTSRTSLYPLSTSCGEMKAPCPHRKAQKNLESSIPESKMEQGLGLGDQKKHGVMVDPLVQDPAFVDEATRSHPEHPNIMQAPQHLQRAFSAPVLGKKDAHLPHPLRQSRRSTHSPFQCRHGQTRARRSAVHALGPGRKSASMPDTRRHKGIKFPIQIACYRFIEGPEHQQNRMMHLWLEQYAYVETQTMNSAAEHRTLPGNERSQSVAPSDAAALGGARGATVEKRNSAKDKASKEQGQKNTTAAQQPEELPPQLFSPQPAHAWMRPGRVATEHEAPRPETPRLHHKSCLPAHLMRLYIQRAWSKLRAASKALFSTIRNRLKKLSKKGGELIKENRFSEPTKLDTDQCGSRRWLRLLAKRKSPRPPLTALKKDLVASEDKTFHGASEAGGANKASSQGGSTHSHQDVLAPVGCREPAQVLVPGSGQLLETQAPAPSQNVDLAAVQVGTAAGSSRLPPDATSGQEQKDKGHTQDKPAPPQRVSPKRKRSSSEQRPSNLPQPPKPTGTNIPDSLMQELLSAIHDLNQARQTADELQKLVQASFSKVPTNNVK